MECLGALENFLQQGEVPVLIRAGLSHVQFETIHPILDGNGRVGRLLITLLLIHEGLLREPLLYLSLYLKKHRAEYYRLLDAVRYEGDWEAWLEFFLRGVEETANGAVESANRLLRQFRVDAARIEHAGSSVGRGIRVSGCLKRRPLVTIDQVSAEAKLSFPTVSRAVSKLADLGILREVTGRARNRVFAYTAHVEILNDESPPAADPAPPLP